MCAISNKNAPKWNANLALNFVCKKYKFDIAVLAQHQRSVKNFNWPSISGNLSMIRNSAKSGNPNPQNHALRDSLTQYRTGDAPAN